MVSAESAGAPTRLRCEYLVDPLGIEERRPRLSWWATDSRRGAVQSAYRALAAGAPDLLREGQADLWDSGKVDSDQNVNVEYGGVALESRRRCFWKVRTWDAAGDPSPWSRVASWEMGLLEADDWRAEWIGLRSDATPPPATYLRLAFAVPQRPVSARLYATALGCYEPRLNGQRIADHVFAPGWTDYHKRVMYQSYDVTAVVREGENVLGAIVGEGWYCGRVGFGKDGTPFGIPPPRFLAQLEVRFDDGSIRQVVTNNDWRGATGPIVYSSIYDGERYDARLEMPGWDAPGFDDADWRAVEVLPDPGIVRTAQQDPPIRVTQEIEPVGLTEPSPGAFVVDMGQNMVGCCRLRVSGPAGTEVRLRHAEVLEPDGNLYTENLRSARATDSYILEGDGPETFVPRFTYHGFRYVEITGYPGRPERDALTGLVLHTDCERTAAFDSSSTMLNRLHENIVWGQRGNMHSVLTDCPQRDERLGWMGDAQIFARTACFNMDMAAMLAKFARDMTDEQTPDGAFPDVCPYVSAGGALPPAGAPAWMDAGVIVPWTIYMCYGDQRILERHVDSMLRYVDFVASHNPDGIWENARGNDYGDWVPAGAHTDKTVFATLHLFRSADLTAKAARALGRDADAARMDHLAARVRTAFNGRYLENGRYSNATQTVNALTLAFGVVPEEHRAGVADDLVADIKARGGHLSTGFGGTQWLLPALCDTGHAEVAHRLLLNRDYPSWGYMIEKGATTIWELWNSDTEGPGMNSRNHFAYGSVGEWMFRYLAGIDTAEDAPGYGRVVIRPHAAGPEGELTRVRAAYDSMRGRIETEWHATAEGLRLEVTVPANARATVTLPATSAAAVAEGGSPLSEAPGVLAVAEETGRVTCEIGAGRYSFSAR
jgi:alpha-L-rhamnosidase